MGVDFVTLFTFDGMSAGLLFGLRWSGGLFYLDGFAVLADFKAPI